jgi:hypothetical protein
VERCYAATPDSAGTATIIAPPEVLALLIYGRANLAEQEQQGRARVEGDRAVAARFHTLFVGA